MEGFLSNHLLRRLKGDFDLPGLTLTVITGVSRPFQRLGLNYLESELFTIL